MVVVQDKSSEKIEWFAGSPKRIRGLNGDRSRRKGPGRCRCGSVEEMKDDDWEGAYGDSPGPR